LHDVSHFDIGGGLKQSRRRIAACGRGKNKKIPQALRLRLDFVIIRNSRKGRP